MSAPARWVLGTAVLGRPAYINTGSAQALPRDRSVEHMRQNTWAVLDAAVEAGIDWIDTARSYGRAEEFVASWLADRRPSPAPRISSKWGYAYVGDWRLDAAVHEVKEHSLTRFADQWQLSSGLLGADLDLYQVHSLTDDSPLFEDAALLAALHEVRAGGMSLGFSTSGPRQGEAVRRASDLTVDGVRLFDAVQATWNVLETSVGPSLQAAHDAGLTVLVKEALANGRLATSPPEPVRRVADDLGIGSDAVALAAAAHQPFVDRVLLGPASVDQLRANLAADGVTLTSEVLDALAHCAEGPEPYWAHRSALDWR